MLTLIHKPSPLYRDFNRDPNIKGTKTLRWRGLFNNWSTFGPAVMQGGDGAGCFVFATFLLRRDNCERRGGGGVGAHLGRSGIEPLLEIRPKFIDGRSKWSLLITSLE